MKKLFLLAGVVVLAFACTKQTNEVEPVKSAPQKTGACLNISYTEKEVDMNDENNPCKEGNSNCLYYCCVTPDLVNDFMGAIDAGAIDVQDFLSTGTNLQTLSQDVAYYQGLLEDVRDGYKEVTYVQIGSSNLFGFLYGENVSSTNYEAAQILER